MKTVWIDMDGVLADFNAVFDETKRYEMYCEGFFRNLEPLFEPQQLKNILDILRSQGYVVGILTKAVESPYCSHEKLNWVAQHCPWFDDMIILEDEECKSQAIDHIEHAVLFDDYTVNLTAWKAAGGKAVKVGGRMKDDFPHINRITELLEVLL